MARLGVGRDRPVGEAVRLAYPDMRNSLQSTVAGQRRFLPSYSPSAKSDRTRLPLFSLQTSHRCPLKTATGASVSIGLRAALDLRSTPPTGGLVVRHCRRSDQGSLDDRCHADSRRYDRMRQGLPFPVTKAGQRPARGAPCALSSLIGFNSLLNAGRSGCGCAERFASHLPTTPNAASQYQ